MWSIDYTVGFGGKFGVQSDRQDKSAVGWDNIETVEKHQSQVDHSKVSGYSSSSPSHLFPTTLGQPWL